jgi:hypothetical protein
MYLKTAFGTLFLLMRVAFKAYLQHNEHFIASFKDKEQKT